MIHRLSSTLLAAALLAAGSRAQDTVKLENGDELTGTIKTMADGKLTFASKILGDLTVPLDDVETMSSAGDVRVLTKAGDLAERRIVRIDQGGLLVLSDTGSGPAGPILLTDLEAFNPTPVGWSGTLTANGIYVTGNTERRQAGASFEAERRSKVDRIGARGRWDYADEKNVPGVWTLSQRRTYGALKYDYFLSEKWYANANASAEGDLKANLDLRLTAGVGLGLQVVEREDLQFGVEAGVSYFFEDYRTGGPNSETAAGRAAYDLEVDLGAGLRFVQFVETFVGFERADDVLVKKDSRLRATLTDAMFGELSWLLTYDNTPAPGNERLDHTLAISVGWTF